MSPRAPTLAAAGLLLASLALAGETFDYLRVLQPAAEGSGSWTDRFTAKSVDRELVGLAVVADWWDGPGDPRVSDPKLSAMPGVVYEVKRGEGPWVALPAADRDLRLMVRAVAPPDTENLFGGSPDGEWAVRQTAGGSYPHRLRVEFTCRGDRLLVKDLCAKELRLPELDPPPVVGRPHIPDRTENKTLDLGDSIAAEVVVENCGARKTKAVEVALVAAPYGERKGTRLGFAEAPALGPGESAEVKISGTLPEDLTLEGGIWEVLAVVDPRGTQREVETFNNVLTRAFRITPPDAKKKLPDDLRDR
jgi:hypothetical protein